MIVTHITPYMHSHAGGPPVVVDRVCRRFLSRGWDVRVITTDSMADGTDKGWQASYRDHYPLDVHATGKLRRYAYCSTLADALDKAARESDLLHLHTLWTYPTWTAARACRRHNTPFVVMPHGMADPHSLQRKWLRKWLYGRLIEWPYVRAARGMIYTHTEEQRLAEAAVRGLPTGHIVPLGADEPPPISREVLAAEFLAAHPELRGRKLIVFLGRLHSKKGLDLLIPGFAEVVRSMPEAHLLLVGPGDDSYLQSIRGWIASHRLTDKVTFTGPLDREAKWQALAASSVFALPSYQENFALTVVEALRMGVPVVLSRRVNIWEDVTQAGAGLACELAPGSIAEAILQYLRNDAMGTASGAYGQRLVAESFNWERCADAMDAVYRQVLSAPATLVE